MTQDTVDTILLETQERFKQTLENFKSSILNVSAKATPDIFNAIRVEVYGSETPISQVAVINVLDSKTLSVRPYDSSVTGNVSRAIQAANLGVSVIAESTSIRVVMPPMSEERRKSIVKLVTTASENTKVAMRNVRRQQIEKLKSSKSSTKSSTPVISEDDAKRGEKEIEKFFDKSMQEIENILKIKEKEIMSF